MIADYKTAPISEKLRAMLALLEKQTLSPDTLTVDDIRPVLAKGVSREAVRDAFYVSFLFNTYDRLFEIVVSAALGASRKRLLAGLQALDGEGEDDAA